MPNKRASLDPQKRHALELAIDAVAIVGNTLPQYPPALMPVAVAQFILESNWGKAHMGANNYFGIKARAGEPYVELPTKEFVGGKFVAVQARFRRFETAAECFASHGQIFHRTRGGRKIYEKALTHSHDPAAFARSLTGVYATDPQYGEKLIRIMRDYELPQVFGMGAIV